MMRYLLAVRGSAATNDAEEEFTEEYVDIFNEGQLEEHYLCEVNPLGQVPVLANPRLFSFPVAQTTAITMHIMERFPEIAPRDHKNEIMRLSYKMHELNFFTLSFRKSPKLASGFVEQVDRRLAQPGISARYRDALLNKRNVLQAKVEALTPEKVEKELESARAYLAEVSTHLDGPGSGPWLFGMQRPTALDAQLVVMIHRLQDASRGDLIPDKLVQYASKAMETKEYVSVMDGRKSTMYDGSVKETTQDT